MQKKTIVVTGGAGFVGSHLCERLVSSGHHVISLDNYFTGSRDNHVSGVEYREGHTKDITRLVPETPDLIYHLGEYARVEQSVLEPDVVHDLNIVGTAGVIAYWKQKRCKLVYAGSSTKFGDAGKARYTSPYAETKAANSELVRDTGNNEKLPYAITYFYNVYGPRERSGVYGTVIEHFKRMYVSGAPCAIVSPGTQERNFTHVDDIVDGLIAVGEKGQGDEYGLGNPVAYTIKQVADLFGFGADTVLFPERIGNRMTSELNTRKTQELGWSVRRKLPEYISAFTRAHTRGASREKRILVFSTTMHPVAGLAEEALADLARELPDVSFDVITARFTKADAIAPAPNITLHRVGFGTRADKYLLPILGPLKGLSLWRTHSYLFTWSLMASYAALAGIVFKSLVRAPLLVTLADQSLSSLSLLQRVGLSVLLSSADQVYGTHGAQEKDAMKAGGARLPRYSLGEGDAFANALRYAYADIVRRREVQTGAGRPHTKKILIFSLAYFPKPVGGAEIAIQEITDRVPASEFQFYLITQRFEPDQPREETIGNVRIFRVGAGGDYLSKILFIPRAALLAHALNKTERFDGIWAMMSYMLLPVMLARFLGTKIPYAVTLQEGDPFDRVFKRPHLLPFIPLLRAGFAHATVVSAISKFLMRWARTMGYTGKVELVPNGADIEFTEATTRAQIEEVQDELGKGMGDVWLVTASRLVSKNAIDDVLSALTLLPQNVRFVILGKGPDEKKLKAFARQLGVSDRVQFLGFINKNRIPAYLKASDIFIRPSRSEGMGNAFIEAMAAGLPVIATQEGGIADFLYDEKRNPDMPVTGFAVDKNSPRQIADTVKAVMTHTEKVRAVVRTAYMMVKERYDWNLIAHNMREKIFSKL